ncbi:DUF1697 domain-containing protein [Heliobacterium chlorum]|uniref:DUF1697 domain-containing protein n=1 Tax=Heliobacterium chlorum TaxID=2698 RepID=A0ABR7SWY9_HELCL|nr:DUF1697 domain-containing protein [Heliobacterium chlorum]MBC9783065.1 DUF1697 domain-containing protein [Heliobacterium chlorum]
MTTYVALLRGINVGGKNIIKMNELKKSLEAVGLGDVRTYIQSGNLLLKSDEPESALCKKIESQIELSFGFSVAVILRTLAEFEQIIVRCPFPEKKVSEIESLSNSECLYVALLTDTLSQDSVKSLVKYNSEHEEFFIEGRDIYLLFHQSIRNSKLAGQLAKLEVPATIRNWKTMNKLLLLGKEMDENRPL